MERVERVQYITIGSTKEEVTHEVKNVLEGGCKWVQLRMKDAKEETMIEIGQELLTLCSKYNAKLIINDHPHICKTINADGVHLGKSDISTTSAREILGAESIIGRTCNTIEDVESMTGEQIDYIGVGPLRFTTTKKLLSPEIGLHGYKAIAVKSKFPIIAVGGVTKGDIAPLLKQGVYGVAVAGAIAKSQNITATTAEIINEIKFQSNK